MIANYKFHHRHGTNSEARFFAQSMQRYQPPETPTMKPTIAYGRCSTDKQEKSSEVQNLQMKQYASTSGLGLDESSIFLEEDVSGSVPFAKRPMGGEVFRRMKAGEVKDLIVPKIDRLGRNALDVQNTINVIHKLGEDYRIHILDLGGMSFDSRSIMGRLWISIVAYFAEMELERITQRIQAVIDQKRLKGECLGTVPFGWDAVETGEVSAKAVKIRRLVDNPVEQEWIRTMANLRDSGLGYHSIAKHLNAMGCPTKNGAGNIISYSTTGRRAELRGRTLFTSGKWQAGNVAKVLQSGTVEAWLEGERAKQQVAA